MKITRPDLLLPALLFSLSVVSVFVARFLLLSRLRAKLPSVDANRATVGIYLEIQYLKHRRTIRTAALDALTVASLLLPLAAVASAFWLFSK